MISFFKYQDPLRFSMILIILLLLRLPVLIYGYPLLIPELTWQIIGEKMGDGFTLYRDIWTSLEPFSAGTYWFIDAWFGKSQFAYQLLAMILVFIQAVFFNFIVSVNNLYTDKTYVPALLYVIFSSLFFDFYTLSPPILGMTFIILAIHFVFLQIRTVDDNENIFYTGLLIAVASLFYYPYFLFLFLAILSFLMFSGAVLRKYLLMLMGFVFPIMLVFVYYFLKDGLDNFMSSFNLALFADSDVIVSGKVFGTAIAVPIIILICSFFIIYSYSRYINYQYVTIQIFSFWLILSILALYFTRTLSTYHLFIFVPVLSFFGTHLFLLIKKRIIREISFALSVIVILWINYGVLYQFAFKKNPINYDEMIVRQSKDAEVIKDKKVIVLGNDRSYYKDNHLATPYFNWELAQKDFKNLNNYGNISSIYQNFTKDMPDVIIDQNNVVPALFEKVPDLKKAYSKEDGKNIYYRK